MRKWIGLIVVGVIFVQLVNSSVVGAHTVKKTSSPAPDSLVAASHASKGVRVFVNGKELAGKVPARIIDGHTLVPIRDLAESLGKQVEWEPKEQIVTISNGTINAHHHEIYLHPAGTPAPSVKLEVKPDAKSGFNVHVETSNWTWAPENVNRAATPNQGHAHLYVDGVKVARMYGPWYHLDGLEPGSHDITVTLNANNHAEYALDENHKLVSTVSIVYSPAQQDEQKNHTH
jgi:hypothetical protein